MLSSNLMKFQAKNNQTFSSLLLKACQLVHNYEHLHLNSTLAIEYTWFQMHKTYPTVHQHV